jgi:phosphoribosylamine--glycine ligase
MVRAGVPTAAHETFSDPEGARRHLRARSAPVVVKASGLAAGKGAMVCTTEGEALEAVDRIMEDRDFGAAGREVVVEDFMEGEELSIFGITDGRELVLLLPSQDHKRAGEGDTGPNTGGMGAYAPVSIATPERIREARERIFLPTLQALEGMGAPFRGVLYAGLMATAQGLKVVEFNCRFGDPEAQVVLPLLDSSLLELLLASARGTGLGETVVRWKKAAALTTVVVSEGYPGAYETGRPIDLPPEREDTMIFHAGTRRRTDGVLETAGGRVLAVTAVASSLAEAARVSREVAGQVEFEGSQFRRDIGWRELERQG